jgi:hypothetical protein
MGCLGIITVAAAIAGAGDASPIFDPQRRQNLADSHISGRS